MRRVIAYIDGFNLYYGLKSKGWRRYYWLDLHLLARNLLRQEQELAAVKYFTARISATPANMEKQKRQGIYLEAVASLPLTRIYFGHYLPKPRQCLKCGAEWISHEEKMTDVNISVELMQDAFDDRFDTALLVSADSDLSAPVESVLARYPDRRIIMVCPPDRQSKKLESVASASFRIGRKLLQDSQLPDIYEKPDGFVLRRPREWA